MELIYIVEDEENIRDLVAYALNNSNYTCVGVPDHSGLLEKLDQEIPNLILLDVMLEVDDGFKILQSLKSRDDTKDIPVIMLTAKDHEMDKVKALDMGADDYITKPFGIMEMISRIKAVIRRSNSGSTIDPLVAFKDVEINLSSRIVKVAGEIVDLTYKEFELLHYLIKNQNIVLTREKLTSEIWGYDYEGESRTVDVHIRTLRQKLGERDYIKTVRNVGYKIS